MSSIATGSRLKTGGSHLLHRNVLGKKSFVTSCFLNMKSPSRLISETINAYGKYWPGRRFNVFGISMRIRRVKLQEAGQNTTGGVDVIFGYATGRVRSLLYFRPKQVSSAKRLLIDLRS
jgi:hypothetical protein